MNYLLAVLTHGDHDDLLNRTLTSFTEQAQPSGPPAEMIVFADGSMPSLKNVWTLFLSEGNAAGLPAGTRMMGGPQVGFCTATRLLWEAASASSADYVFWLEHDFEFVRAVDLRALAAVLDSDPELAQMALMRDAVNETEEAAGGLYESRPGQYEQRERWLEHAAYFTTNPSLMRRAFMAENPWLDYADQCEGRFGLDLVARGYRFGVWGNGEPWVRHIGERTGFGY